MSPLIIKNNEKEIIETNYFDSELNKAGKFFLSINARAFRLLTPDVFVKVLKEELPLAEYIKISREGLFFRILFEDHSDNPYQIQITHNSMDRIPAEEDKGRKDLTFAVWIREGKKAIKLAEKKCTFL